MQQKSEAGVKDLFTFFLFLYYFAEYKRPQALQINFPQVQ